MPYFHLFSSDMGSQTGAAVIIHASHLPDARSTPEPHTSTEIRRSQSDSEGFSLGALVFLPLYKICQSQSDSEGFSLGTPVFLAVVSIE